LKAKGRKKLAVGDRPAVGAVGPPLAAWAHAVGLVVRGSYVPDAPVGALGSLLMVGSLAAAVAAIMVGLRQATLLGRTSLLLGLYALVLSGDPLSHFLSSLRVLAPTVFAAGLAVAAKLTATANDSPEVRDPAGAPDR
jgi:hypothetical protein